jgi:proline iminopeptidase
LTSQWLPVGGGHEIYVETVGRADGLPAIYLHGGPGSGCQPDHRRLFDPERFHAVLFDQRGAGRSRPKGGREANTLPDLIADMELIREKLGVARWMIIGGSWGATLALAYAQAHPIRVTGIVLRATFLGTRAELEAAFLQNLPRIYPGLNDDFLSLLADEERAAPLDSYWRRILDPDPAVHAPAARAWGDTESMLSQHTPSRTRLDMAALSTSRQLPSTPFMEAHYFRHDCFLRPGQLLAEAGKLAGIPGIIVQGRYDLLCPPSTAHALAAAWPDAEVRTVEGAGHSLYDPGVRDAVMGAIADLAAREKE